MTDVTADALHAVSQALQVPVIVLLLLLLAYSVFCVGTLIAEVFSERKNYKVSMPGLLEELSAADAPAVPRVLRDSGLLKRQKEALGKLWGARGLDEEARYALTKRLVAGELDHYGAVTGRTDLVAKIGPMLGLMGTLIPLGPGIVALGTGDVTTLSGALLIAFDTTVAGLGAAGVALCVSKVRKRWYRQYMETFEAVATTLLEKLDKLAAEGLEGADFGQVMPEGGAGVGIPQASAGAGVLRAGGLPEDVRGTGAGASSTKAEAKGANRRA